ncbi:SGNH/GDSL hydrolase family protein [Patescibacteria group bacterium]|nr:SGNH/GDSL hydrolase family protein [Patescibacteria group bacterium]
MPIDESKVDPIPWLPEVSYKNEYIKRYDKIIKSVCAENKIAFIEIFEKLKKENCKNLLEDGVHPNSKGHEKIFEIVKDYLIENKII